ncbi:hypothetical protein [Leisingera sp. ANG-M7]|uniref:hypothetical protein n=1 Tax=Leisingera sp. ANG-M7 TaxID=1577902 RepID=UPI00057E2DCD|nr:hypothetical protein [Leisingera sp. ANG-M7]KIC39344.1 hypothetical protein RA26_01440 [Leisingera sp. ANG-M7]
MLYLLIKNGYYYRLDAQGYTASKAEAGRFHKEEAIQLCTASSGVTMVELDKAEEVAPICTTGMSPDPDLARDAARYRWLRDRDLNTIDRGGVFAGLTPENVILNGEDLDLHVDAAMASN